MFNKRINNTIMRKLLIIVFLCLLSNNLTSQDKTGRLPIPVEYKGKSKPILIKDTTSILLQVSKPLFTKDIKSKTKYVEVDHEEIEETIPESVIKNIKRLEERKSTIEKKKLLQKTKLKYKVYESESTSKYVINEDNAGCPPDNTVAISRSGYIVAADNAQIGFYNENGNEVAEFSYPDFLNPVREGLGNNTSDPKVIYDYESDRFVFFIQINSGDTDRSECVLAFSREENPSEGWNVYVFHQFRDENPHWFDYPGLAYNEEEFFLTGNLIKTTGNVIFQLDKKDGYRGRDMNGLMWLDIKQPGDNKMASTLFPMQTIPLYFYERDMIFASIASGGGVNCYYYRINNRINQNPELSKYEVDIPDYDAPTKVSQKDTEAKLDGGFVKIRGGYFFDNRVYFVFVKPDQDGFNGIAFVRINIENLQVKTKFFHDNQNSEYCQPNIVHRGNHKNSHQALLVYQRSGVQNWPEIRIRKIKSNMSADGNSITLQTSDSFRRMCGTRGRWGDYIGVQRKGTSNFYWITGHTANSQNLWRSHLIKIGL